MLFAALKKNGPTIALSLALHVACTVALSRLTYGVLSVERPIAEPLAPPPTGVDPGKVAVVLPTVGQEFAVDEEILDTAAPPPTRGAGDPIAHPDTEHAGHGGTAESNTPAQNLADANERMRLSPDLVSRLDRDQLQRLRVARARVSWEDRRCTTHPAELTLLVSGPGAVRERRPLAPSEPSRGALESPRASLHGASIGAPKTSQAIGDRTPGSERAGSLDEAPGVGRFTQNLGDDHRASAPVGSARPAITLGPVAVQASDVARPRDNVDSDQEVATTIRLLVHASTAGGMPGEGPGGSGGGGQPGEGGAFGAEFRARPLGEGEGEVYDYWTRDPRLLPYFRTIHARIDPLWADAFPKSALLELKQGTTILEFMVSSDGRVTVLWPPLRPSGIDEFDRNCANAIRRAGPFPPIPATLGVSSLRIRAPFVANNPVVK